MRAKIRTHQWRVPLSSPLLSSLPFYLFFFQCIFIFGFVLAIFVSKHLKLSLLLLNSWKGTFTSRLLAILMSIADFLEFSLNNSSPYSIILKRNNIILHQLPTSFHLNQVWIKFSTGQCVKEVICDIDPMDSSHLLLGWAWLRFKTLNLDECSLYLRHEGHKMKLKFMTPRQVSKDQHSLKEKIRKKE